MEFSTCPQGQHSLIALNVGEADIVQSGPMRSMIAADWGAEVVPTHFIEINSRDGFFIMGRGPQEKFQWADLKGATMIPIGFSPTPKASLNYALKKVGVVLAEMHLLDGLPLREAVDAFRRGEGDFIHVPQPDMEQLIQDGVGYLAAPLGPVIGHISYSSFVATHRYLAASGDVVQRFTQGLIRS